MLVRHERDILCARLARHPASFTRPQLFTAEQKRAHLRMDVSSLSSRAIQCTPTHIFPSPISHCLRTWCRSKPPALAACRSILSIAATLPSEGSPLYLAEKWLRIRVLAPTFWAKAAAMTGVLWPCLMASASTLAYVLPWAVGGGVRSARAGA